MTFRLGLFKINPFFIASHDVLQKLFSLCLECKKIAIDDSKWHFLTTHVVAIFFVYESQAMQAF